MGKFAHGKLDMQSKTYKHKAFRWTFLIRSSEREKKLAVACLRPL